MPEYKFTAYFENEVLRKRPYLKKEWCVRIIENPIRVKVQGDSRVRFWGWVKEFHNLVFRVVTLADKVTIDNPKKLKMPNLSWLAVIGKQTHFGS
jgi:hypothetical protein